MNAGQTLQMVGLDLALSLSLSVILSLFAPPPLSLTEYSCLLTSIIIIVTLPSQLICRAFIIYALAPHWWRPYAVTRDCARMLTLNLICVGHYPTLITGI